MLYRIYDIEVQFLSLHKICKIFKRHPVCRYVYIYTYIIISIYIYIIYTPFGQPNPFPTQCRSVVTPKANFRFILSPRISTPLKISRDEYFFFSRFLPITILFPQPRVLADITTSFRGGNGLFFVLSFYHGRVNEPHASERFYVLLH